MDAPGMKKKPGLMIAVGVGKGPKPPGMDKEDDMRDAAPDDKGAGGGGKHTEAEAHKVSADQHCKDCKHYQADSGECDTVAGYWDPEDACIRFFEAGGGDEEVGESPDDEAAEGEMPEAVGAQ